MGNMSERLKALRIQANMTQQDVATLIQKSKGNVSGYEKGTFEPSASTIIRLAECFNISTDYILTGKTDSDSGTPSSPAPSLKSDEEELLNNYRKLDSRRQHHIQLLVYDEVDEQDKELRLRAGESYESVFGPSQEEPRPTRPPSKIPRIPFVAKGDDKISEEDDQMIQEKLRAMEERSRKIREKREE